MVKTFVKYATGSLAALIAGLITTPILTRLISTEEMGKYSMFITIGSLFASILYFGFDQSYVRYYNEELPSRRVFLLQKCLRFPLIGTGVVSIASFIFYKRLSVELIGTSSFPVVILFVLYLFGLVIDRFWLLKLRMEQKAGSYSVLNVVRKLSYLAIGVILYFAYFGDTCWSLIVAVTLAEFILLAGSRWADRGEWKVDDRKLAVSTQALAKYGAPFIFSTTITLILHSTDKLMLNAMSDYNQVGLYSGAQNIVNLLTQVQTVFTTFWMPVAFEQYAKDPDDKDFYVRMNKLVSYVMLIIAVTLLVLKDIVVLFLGAKYREAVYVFPFLAFMPIMYTVSETTVMGINFKKKTNYHVITSGACAVTNIIGNYFLIQLFGAKGAAISTGLSYVLFMALRTVFSNSVYPVKFVMGRFVVSGILVYALAIVASFQKTSLYFVIASVVVIVIITILYRDILADGIKIAMEFLRGKRGNHKNEEE